MDLHIDPRYNRHSIFVVLHLLHNNQEFSDMWLEKYPDQVSFATNYFKDENCGCKTHLIRKYRQDRFAVDVMVAKFIEDNEGCVDFDKVEEESSTDISGQAFSMPATEGHYQDFLASLQQKNAMFNHFTPVILGEKLIVTFF